MDAVMITGATGLIGSNVCRILTGRGQQVRALVRSGSETEPLAALGVELVEGDIANKDDVARAAKGCGSIINSAALLGGAAQDMDASKATNYGGSLHCYDVAMDGGRRVVELATTTFLRHDAPLDEHPEVVEDVYRMTRTPCPRLRPSGTVSAASPRARTSFSSSPVALSARRRVRIAR